MPVLLVDESELELLREALDSHAYWQLSAEEFRSDGFVIDPGTMDEDDAAELADVKALDDKLAELQKQAAAARAKEGTNGR